MIPFNNLYDYKPMQRVDGRGGRRYGVDGKPVPSVTTILSKTKDMTAIKEWRKRVGEVEANKITKASANIGTHIHDFIEKKIIGEDYVIGTQPIQKQADTLANIIYDKGIDGKLSEYWGTETGLHYETLYAGTTDLVGIYEDEECIVDFKNTRKPKKESYIIDYKLQLVAYGLAHNEMFGTNIRKGVILMASREPENFGEFQRFVLEGDEWNNIIHQWIQKVEDFYRLES